MLKTPEQILEEIKKHFEEVKNVWNKWNEPGEKENFLEKGKFLLFLRERGDPQIPEKMQKVLIFIDEALARGKI